MKKLLLLLVLPTLLCAEDSAGQRTRIEKLQNTFLAPCCYSEPVSRHRSEVSLQMRAEIAKWVAEGKPDQEIIEIYKQRYGTKVLVEPQGGLWWAMHVIPWIALFIGLAFTVWLLRRMRAQAANA